MTQDKFYLLFLCTLNDTPDISDIAIRRLCLDVFCFANLIILSKMYTLILIIIYTQIHKCKIRSI